MQLRQLDCETTLGYLLFHYFHSNRSAFNVVRHRKSFKSMH